MATFDELKETIAKLQTRIEEKDTALDALRKDVAATDTLLVEQTRKILDAEARAEAASRDEAAMRATVTAHLRSFDTMAAELWSKAAVAAISGGLTCVQAAGLADGLVEAAAKRFKISGLDAILKPKRASK